MMLRLFMKHMKDQNWFTVGLYALVVITCLFYQNPSIVAQEKNEQNLMVETIKLGLSVSRMTIGDVNEDGRPDLLAVNPQEGFLSVMVSEGGKFLTVKSYATGGGMPADLDVGDINQDGHIDVVIANHETSNVSVMTGDGKGHFALKQRIETGSKPHVHAVALARLNNDDFPDLVVDSWGDNKLLIFFGQRDGFESTPKALTVPAQPRTNIVAADLNGDGLDEIITPATSSAGITIIYPDGEGEFTVSSTAVGPSPFYVAVGTLGQNKYKSVVAVHRSGNSRNATYDLLSILKQNEQRVYTEINGSPIDLNGSPSLASMGDFKCEGIAQLVTLNQRTNDYAIILFGADETKQTRHSFGEGPRGVAIADFDGNGCDDIAISWHDSKSISVQYN